MIKTPLSTVIGGAFWTPGATILGSSSQNLTQLIKSLFSLGEQGFAYDPSDLSTLYQDAAGIIPVTAEGQPVGLMKDKSGRNNHAYQSVSASRPLLQRNATTGAYYLAFDGVDDFLQTNNIDFTATDKVSLLAGVRKLSNTGGQVVGLGDVFAPSGSFSLENGFDPSDFGTQINVGTRISNYTNSDVYNAPFSAVLCSALNINTLPRQVLRVNGIIAALNNTSSGSGNFGSLPVYIGRRAGTVTPFNGHLYSLIGIGRLTTDSETIALEKSIAKNTGVTLNV